MRVGVNPEKYKKNKNFLRKHRVIITFFVPDSEDAYFKELDKVLDKCLESLFKTIDQNCTVVTLVNNCSSSKIDFILNKYVKFIDKYVYYTENKGKVYAVLNEARCALEEFITISDADILFFKGWESAVFDVFSNYPKAGVVSPYPCPYLTFHYNQSVFGDQSLKNNIRYGKFVDDKDIDLYVKGTNLPKIIDRKTNFNWKEKQFVLNKPMKVVVGAYHVVSTYRTTQFRNIYTFAETKFENSYESEFIDCLADKKGMYRLSTIKSYIYHMGNTLDDVEDSNQVLETNFVGEIKQILYKETFPVIVFIKRIIGRIFIKFYWKNL